MPYTFRLDASDTIVRDDVRKWFEEQEDFDRYLVYEEIADKTNKLHWQGVIYTELKIDTVRKRIQRYFKVSGSQSSVATVKTDNYEVYITKDGNRLCSKGYSDDEIEKLYSQSYQKSEMKNKNFIQLLEEDFEKYFDDNYADKLGDEYDRFDQTMGIKEVMEWIIKFIVNRQKWNYMNTKQVTSLANYLVMKYTSRFRLGTSIRDNFIKQCLNEFRF